MLKNQPLDAFRSPVFSCFGLFSYLGKWAFLGKLGLPREGYGFHGFLKSPVFLLGKTMGNRKMYSKADAFRKFKKGEIAFPPLSLKLEDLSVHVGGFKVDAIISARWESRLLATFAMGYKATGTPKEVRSALGEVRRWGLGSDMQPLVMVPYLNEERLKEFEQEKISAIDLCGNGVIFVRQRLMVYRTGGENQFKSDASIKNIYRRKTSLVPRVFLSRPRFSAVKDIQDEVNGKDMLVKSLVAGKTSLSTVSKALKSMEEDLLIQRDSGIGLLQPEKLLDLLSDNYEPPRITARTKLKVPVEGFRLLELLREEASRLSMPWVVAGLSSVSQYAVMQRGEMMSVYCPEIMDLLPALQARETDRFPNLELVQCEDERVYFDPLEKDGFYWASAVQTYLELMAGDKRDRETAPQVKSHILRECERKG
ncbi:MAG: hypothetical protein JJU11_17840 [Candidatus Sumerlaeia bacterium]|nr:hypothetical protein [Candidatus Sumerlaeia bacterium]